MANYYTPDVFDELLEKHKKRRENTRNYKASDFRQFTPKELDTSYIKPQPFYENMQNAIVDRSRIATQVAREKAQNEAAYRAMIAARRAAQRAQRNAIAYNPQSFNYVKGSGGSGLGAVNGVGVGQNLRTVSWRGHSMTLNRSVVDNFVGFLNALWRTGYRPKSIGSYSNRNIAGTSTKSLHAYGLAIDIDPGRNPVTWNGVNITALPPGVGALAARYGLKWGGSWRGSKRDTMHFSVPWGGRM